MVMGATEGVQKDPLVAKAGLQAQTASSRGLASVTTDPPVPDVAVPIVVGHRDMRRPFALGSDVTPGSVLDDVSRRGP